MAAMPILLALGLGLVLWMVAWAVVYQWRLVRLDLLQRRWGEFIEGTGDEEPLYAWLSQRTAEFIGLVKGAGVQDSTFGHVEPRGLGMVETSHVSYLHNWLARRRDTVQFTYRAFEYARGVYKDRRLQSLNPVHWAVMFLTLPMQAVKWAGGNPDGTLSRAMTVLWGLIVAASVILGVLGIGLLDLVREGLGP